MTQIRFVGCDLSPISERDGHPMTHHVDSTRATGRAMLRIDVAVTELSRQPASFGMASGRRIGCGRCASQKMADGIQQLALPDRLLQHRVCAELQGKLEIIDLADLGVA